ncbi:hypothetical protein CW751_03030 [Brumimicrobium salinarum]|uniref:S9 family peptidase n=1 Tax=Brumimicrobium salinarum TaxID=2058658 RepID=A0A2I0R6W6_9FLAO|nr:hypothetical protein [Brumimicrobium salinarum]PKR82322.1 hypothetical protein CW751_03030 [Brumimicrobium salinarum]
MLKILILILSSLILTFKSQLFAQKEIINHTVYNDWKSLKNVKISPQGNFTTYLTQPHRGDGVLMLFNNESHKKHLFERGKDAYFSQKEDVFVFTITPGFDTLRSLELNKVEKKKWVKDTLGIFWTAKDSLIKEPHLLNFKIAKNGNHLLYLVDRPDEKPTQKNGDFSRKKRKKTRLKAKETPWWYKISFQVTQLN